MAEGVNALVIFTDVRGFSRWSEANEVFVNLRGFIDGFMAVLRARFKAPAFEIRSRGDGALIYRRIDADLSRAEVSRLLARTLNAVRQVDADFARHCREFGHRVGHGAELSAFCAAWARRVSG